MFPGGTNQQVDISNKGDLLAIRPEDGNPDVGGDQFAGVYDAAGVNVDEGVDGNFQDFSVADQWAVANPAFPVMPASVNPAAEYSAPASPDRSPPAAGCSHAAACCCTNPSFTNIGSTPRSERRVNNTTTTPPPAKMPTSAPPPARCPPTPGPRTGGLHHGPRRPPPRADRAPRGRRRARAGAVGGAARLPRARARGRHARPRMGRALAGDEPPPARAPARGHPCADAAAPPGTRRVLDGLSGVGVS